MAHGFGCSHATLVIISVSINDAMTGDRKNQIAANDGSADKDDCLILRRVLDFN
jgi:hypothetical protein